MVRRPSGCSAPPPAPTPARELFSLAFFDALLYEGQTVGGAVRQAKNFLATYAQLKQKRLGEAAVATAPTGGRRGRSPWAIRPSGCRSRPAATLPASATGSAAPAWWSTCRRRGTTGCRPTVIRCRCRPARLAGLIRKGNDDDGRPLVPFVFAEVHLPAGHAGPPPQLRSRLPDTHWAFLWDGRRQTGYLIATPRRLDLERGALRFQVEWTGVSALAAPSAAGGGS
ncbi:MAG: hypothetical protein U0736_08115 [Gemmataceae bacterium]